MDVKVKSSQHTRAKLWKNRTDFQERKKNGRNLAESHTNIDISLFAMNETK